MDNFIIPDSTKVNRVVKEVSEGANHNFTPSEVANMISYTVRKCELNGKDEEYFYILLENELKDSLIRGHINRMGEDNKRRAMQYV